MAIQKLTPPRGLVRASRDDQFDLVRYEPSAELAPFVDDYWITHWDLGDEPDHEQAILAHPCVHVAVGDGPCGVVGIPRGRGGATLSRRGRAFGIKFRPAMFRAVWNGSAARMTGTRASIASYFGAHGSEFEHAVLDTDTDDRLVELAEGFVRSLGPDPNDSMLTARDATEHVAHHRDMCRVDALAARAGQSVRRLQRLFRDYVGVSPKWVIQRYRLHDALARLEVGADIDFAHLAARLHYSDQAHFVRDFHRTVGTPPGEYVRRRHRADA